MKCPRCGDVNYYEGFTTRECGNLGCSLFNEKQYKLNKKDISLIQRHIASQVQVPLEYLFIDLHITNNSVDTKEE